MKASFIKNKGEESMIKRWEKLCYVKSQCACLDILDPTWLNNISEKHTCIRSRMLLKSTELMRINEVVGNSMELYSFPDNFFN